MMHLIQEGILQLSNTNNEFMTIEELNFKISITKIIFSLIYEREEQFIDFLKQPQMQNTFTDFLNLLFSESCKILKTPVTLQLDWVEQKCFEIRKEACESKITLTKQKDLYGQVVIDKAFFSYNISQKEKKYFDYDLVGALNFENIVDMQLKVGFFISDETIKSPEFLIINGPDLFTPIGLKRFSDCEIALTTGLNLEEYQVYLEKQERTIKGISEKPLIMIDQEDFDDVIAKYRNNEEFEKVLNYQQVKDSMSKQEEVKEQSVILAEWTNLDQGKIEKALKNVENEFTLASKINGLIRQELKRIEQQKKKKLEREEKMKKLKEEGKQQQEIETIIKEEEDKKEEEEKEEHFEEVEEEKFEELKGEEKPKIDPKVIEKRKREKIEQEKEAMMMMVLDLVQ